MRAVPCARGRATWARRLARLLPGASAAAGLVPSLLLGAAAASALAPRAGTAQGVDPDSAATLAGTVVSAVTGAPLPDAQIVHLGSRLGAITDSVGGFRIPGLPPGLDTVRVTLIGYAEAETPLRLAPGVTTRAVFMLAETVLRVAELHVEVKRSPLRDPLAEFERRRARGSGYFITPEMIEKQNTEHASDLLRGVPGLTVGPWEPGGASILVVRANQYCRPTMYLNGMLWPGHHIDELDRNTIIGIEVYRGPAEMPPRFQFGGRATCGVLVIWTRQGGSDDPR